MCNSQYRSNSVNWRVNENEEFKACEDFHKYVSASAFVRYKHNRINASTGANVGKSICCNINAHIAISDSEDDREADGDEIFVENSFEVKIWNAVQKLIPTFGDYKKIEISASFIDCVFSPIIPDSPLIALARHKRTALHICAYVLLLIEAPIRHFGVFIICRAMDLYSLVNPNFAEFYKFRAKINSNHPLSEVIKNIPQ